MKHAHILILLLFFLLGCAPGNSGSIPKSPEPIHPFTASAPPEAKHGLRTAALPDPGCTGICSLGDDLLLIGNAEEGTLLTRLDGETLEVRAAAVVKAEFSTWAFSMQPDGDGLRYFDPHTQQTVVLDALLREQRRIEAPEGLTGIPLLSRDGKTLYYCTDAAIRALDLETGISRMLKQTQQQDKTLAALLLGDSVLRCNYSGPVLGARSIFLSASTGQTLGEQSSELRLWTADHRYYAAFGNGWITSLVFGTAEHPPRLLLPRDWEADCTFLPELHAAVTVTYPDGAALLEYYCLEDGSSTASLPLEEGLVPSQFTATAQGRIFFLARDCLSGQQLLCCWEPEAIPGEQPFTGIYYSQDTPDTAGLLTCQNYARELGAKYGLQILIWEDAVRNQPSDYDLAPEYQVHLIMTELEQLAQQLEKFPEGFLKSLAEDCGSVNICLVRSIRGSAAASHRDHTGSIQFWKDKDAYLAFALGSSSEQAFYNALYHIVDIRVLSESSACDRWEQYNPGDFQYDFDYLANRTRDGSIYLQEHSRSFIDTYAMSFPREDRARIWEYAMTQGHGELFRAPILQQKLRMLCLGIREAFELSAYPAPLPWEQYLQQPLTPGTG